jgi:hypothetical protein
MGYLILTLVFLAALASLEPVPSNVLNFGFGGLVKGIGKVAKKAAPFAGLIPGVGTLAAAGLGGAGGLLAGEGLKGALTGAAGGALGGLGGKLIGGAGGLGGVVRGIGGFAKSNPGLILGGLGAIQSARDRTRQQDLIDRTMGDQQADLARRRALEDRIVTGIGSRGARPNLSRVYADPSNVFAGGY